MTGQPTSERADHFRVDLEGLRGVAVVVVVLFHARILGFGGGFIGVDVFFVLSGFLITGLLSRELSGTGRIDLVAFYARRARRLLPASVTVLVITLLAARLLLPPLDVPGVAGDAVATALYAGNIRFALSDIDYLGGAGPPSPLLHYWSLGAEEQFYLVWPALLMLVTVLVRRRGADLRRALMATIGVTLVASFAASLVLTEVAQPWAFFSLPSRAWELAFGASVALRADAVRRVPGSVAALAGWLGLGAILLATLVIDERTSFPGWAALLPVLGATAVIAFGQAPRGPGAVLAARPLRWLGRVSYSLYLWHWPVLLLPVAALGGELPLAVRVVLIGVSVAAAAISQRYVEEPIHRGPWLIGRSGRTLGLAGAATLSAVLLAVNVGASASVPEIVVAPPPTDAAASPGPAGSSPAPTGTPVAVRPALADLRADLPPVYSDGCHLGILDTRQPACAYGGPGPTTVALVGDSHAAQWFPALEAIALQRGWRLLSLTKSGCSMVDIPTIIARLKRTYTECQAWRAGIVARLQQAPPDLLVIATSGTLDPVDPADADPARQAAALARVIRDIGVPTAIMVDTPRMAFDPPDCLSRHPTETGLCATPRAEAFAPGFADRDREAARLSGATLVDLSAAICPADPCPIIVDAMIAFRDIHHLSATFARSLAGRLAAALPVSR